MMSHKLVHSRSHHVAMVALLQYFNVLLGCEDGEVSLDERAVVELSETSWVETEGSDCVRDSLQDVN